MVMKITMMMLGVVLVTTQCWGAAVGTTDRFTVTGAEASKMIVVGSKIYLTADTEVTGVALEISLSSGYEVVGTTPTQLSRGKSVSCRVRPTAPDASEDVKTYNIVFPTAEVTKVIFLNDQNVMLDYDSNYQGDGNKGFTPRGWAKGEGAVKDANNPVSFTMGKSVKIQVSYKIMPVNEPVVLSGDGSIKALKFKLSFSHGVGRSPNSENFECENALAKKIDIIDKGIDWTATFGGANGLTLKAGTSGPHKICVLWDMPKTTKPTFIRITNSCEIAKGEETLEGIGLKIGPTAVAVNKLDGNVSAIGGKSEKRLPNAWCVLDGKKADCVTLCTLLKYELDIIGAPGAQIGYVFPRTKSWTGLWQLDSAQGRSQVNDSNRPLIYINDRVPNIFEGCCSFQGQWWMGGTGTFRKQPVEVLHAVADPNNDPGQNHQCFVMQVANVVPFPKTKPPTYK